MQQITKSHNHDHFWFKDGVLYESYNTIRGMRWREIGLFSGYSDDDTVLDGVIEKINEELKNA